MNFRSIILLRLFELNWCKADLFWACRGKVGKTALYAYLRPHKPDNAGINSEALGVILDVLGLVVTERGLHPTSDKVLVVRYVQEVFKKNKGGGYYDLTDLFE